MVECCHICHEVMPEVVTYRDRYKDHGLQMIGVHMPKQESDTDVEKVKKDISDYGISQPVAIDNLQQNKLNSTKKTASQSTRSSFLCLNPCRLALFPIRIFECLLQSPFDFNLL